MSATFSVPLPPLSEYHTSDLVGADADADADADVDVDADASAPQGKSVHSRSTDIIEPDESSESKPKRVRKTKISPELPSSIANLNSNPDETDQETIDRPTFTEKQIFDISQKHDFFMILNNCTPFKDLVDLIHPVLEQINFNVIERMTKKGQLFRGITVNSMDPNKIAMITARLRFDTIFPKDLGQDQDFCVSSASFPGMMGSIEKGSSIEIKRLKSGNDVIIRGFNANVKNNESIVSFPTIDYVKDKSEEFRFDTMEYKYSIDIELSALRSLVRIAQSQQINARNIEFKIYELVNPKAGVKINKLSISYDSGPNIVKLTKHFFSKTQWDRNTKQTVITSSDYSEEIGDDTRMVLVLFEKFTAKYMNLFLKSMDRPIINLLISNGKPLVIIYPLNGGEDVGRCNFILAPAIKEENE